MYAYVNVHVNVCVRMCNLNIYNLRLQFKSFLSNFIQYLEIKLIAAT